MSLYQIRLATIADADDIIALLPRLADFDVPPARNPDHLWQGDRELVLAWQQGNKPQVHAWVACPADEGTEELMGVAIISVGEELLSHEPSAHLEVLATSASAQGQGIGSALLEAAQNGAREQGAGSMSLHVFARNSRAREVYERAGFDGELMRYYKPL